MVTPPHKQGPGGGFQTQVARCLTGRLPRRTQDRRWRYTLAASAREEAGFLTVKEFIRRRQNTVAQYIATQSLLDLCEGSERAPGARVGMWWWEQATIDLAGAREVAAATAKGDGGDE